MSPGKGGIGRRPGKKWASRQNQKSVTSLTAGKKHIIQLQREVEKKIADRKERRNYHAIAKSGVAMVAITESEILSKKILSTALFETNKKEINPHHWWAEWRKEGEFFIARK